MPNVINLEEHRAARPSDEEAEIDRLLVGLVRVGRRLSRDRVRAYAASIEAEAGPPPAGIVLPFRRGARPAGRGTAPPAHPSS